MFDEMDYATIQVGERLEGTRKPSEVLASMQGDTTHASFILAEGGHDWVDAHYIEIQRAAFEALARSAPQHDTEIGTGEEEIDPEVFVFHELIGRLIDLVTDLTPPLTFYGWKSEDPESDDFWRFGCWVNWGGVDSAIQNGVVIEITDPRDMDDEEYRSDLMAEKALYALFDGPDDINLYDLRDGTVLW